MKDYFDMTNLRKMTFFLGMEVQQKKNDILIYQHKYAKEILKKSTWKGASQFQPQ